MNRKINLVVIHCAATPPDMDIGRREIDGWHRQRGFDGVGYHYVIRRGGQLEVGRDESAVGEHARGHNARSIGICLVGGVRREGKRLVAEDNFTPAQWARLRALVKELHERYPEAKIVGHRDLDARKECPSFSVRDWLAREKVLHNPIEWDSGAIPEVDKRPVLATKTAAGAVVSGGAGLAAVGEAVTEHAQTAQVAAAPFPRIYIVLAVLVLVGTALTLYGRWRAKQRSGQ